MHVDGRVILQCLSAPNLGVGGRSTTLRILFDKFQRSPGQRAIGPAGHEGLQLIKIQTIMVCRQRQAVRIRKGKMKEMALALKRMWQMDIAKVQQQTHLTVETTRQLNGSSW